MLSALYKRERQFLHWFFSELNHSKLVSIIHVMSLGNSSTLYYIVVLAFTAFLGLICVKHVNAHCCFVLAYPHLANTCPFFLCFQVCVQDMSMCCPFCPMFPCHSVPCRGYSSIISLIQFVTVSHHIDTVHILCWLFKHCSNG